MDGNERTYEIRDPEKSLGDLVGEMASEFSALVSSHVELAKTEIRQDFRQATRAGAMVGAAAVGALLALFLLSMAAAWGLAEVMAPGWAFLIVGAVWAVVAGALGFAGKKRLDTMEPGPRATADELREDKQWLKTQNS